jgi:hypothetical protein
MNKLKDISKLNSRCFTVISDSLELEIRAGKFIEQGWAANIFPGMWIYKVGDTNIQIQQTDKTGFTFEAMIV